VAGCRYIGMVRDHVPENLAITNLFFVMPLSKRNLPVLLYFVYAAYFIGLMFYDNIELFLVVASSQRSEFFCFFSIPGVTTFFFISKKQVEESLLAK